jgi:hypothetical protein
MEGYILHNKKGSGYLFLSFPMFSEVGLTRPVGWSAEENKCTLTAGKMGIVGPHDVPCVPPMLPPYSRFALDDLALRGRHRHGGNIERYPKMKTCLSPDDNAGC